MTRLMKQLNLLLTHGVAFLVTVQIIRIITYIVIPPLWWGEPLDWTRIVANLSGLESDAQVFLVIFFVTGLGFFPRLLIAGEALMLALLLFTFGSVSFLGEKLKFQKIQEGLDLIDARNAMVDVIPVHVPFLALGFTWAVFFVVFYALKRADRWLSRRSFFKAEADRQRVHRIRATWGLAITMVAIGTAATSAGEAMTSEKQTQRRLRENPTVSVFKSYIEELKYNYTMRREFFDRVDVDTFRTMFYDPERFDHVDRSMPLLRQPASNAVDSHAVIKQGDLNVIVLILESVYTDVLSHKVNGRPIAPNFTKLMQEGLFFSDHYATYTVSVGAYEALFYGTPPYTVKLTEPKREGYRNLLDLLHERGYESAAFTGAHRNFVNIRRKMQDNVGHQNFWSSWEYQQELGEEIPASDRAGRGIHDHIVLDRMYDWIKQRGESQSSSSSSSPFFLTYISVSSHAPFVAFDNEVVNEKKLVKNPQTRVEQYYNIANYALESVAEFINRCRQLPEFDQTLFVVFGDHLPHVIPKYEPYKELWEKSTDYSADRVPLLFYGPKIVRPSQHIGARLASQIDIAPTILDFLSHQEANMFMGQSLVSTAYYSDRIIRFPRGYRVGPLWLSDFDETKILDHAAEKETVQPEEIRRMAKAYQHQLPMYKSYLNGVVR